MRKGQVDDNLVKLAVDYVMGHYKLKDYVEKFGLTDGMHREGQSTLVIKCFRHDDKTPSLKIDEDRNLYNCLSCGHGGNLIQFIADYKRTVQGIRTTFYSELEAMLKADPVMQLRVGGNTLYKNVEIDVTGITRMNVRRSLSFNAVEQKPKTYLELSRKIKREMCDTNTILTSVDLMQQGLSPEAIYDVLFKYEKKDTPDVSFNIGDILGDV